MVKSIREEDVVQSLSVSKFSNVFQTVLKRLESIYL